MVSDIDARLIGLVDFQQPPSGKKPPTPRKVKRRLKKRRYKPFLPSIIMGNVRSLASKRFKKSKMEELAALVREQREYRECSLIVFYGDMDKGGYP